MRLGARNTVINLAGELVLLGFRLKTQSASGSLYLSYPGVRWLMRVSDHHLPASYVTSAISFVVGSTERDEIGMMAAEYKHLFLAAAKELDAERA